MNLWDNSVIVWLQLYFGIRPVVINSSLCTKRRSLWNKENSVIDQIIKYNLDLM